MAAVLRRAFFLARRFVIFEIGIWRSLFLLVTRRVSGYGPGVEAFPYSRDIAPLMGAFIFVSVLELPVVHLLLPWETVRLIAMVLSIWGLIWMVGLLASMKVFPHLLDDNGLRIRSGTTIDIRIPWEAVASVTARRRSGPPSQVERTDDGTVLNLAVLKQTKIDVELHRPTTIKLPHSTEQITELRFYVDDPRALVAAARERLTVRLPQEQLTSSR
ncbi:MAG: PH domain-containing protein [Solirubrobacteraceae bacterium]